MNDIPDCFYRVSTKALILNETRDKFLICKKENGEWELPGGGTEHGSTVKENIEREIAEEMHVPVTYVANKPSYFHTGQSKRRKLWIANVIFETEVEHLNFTPSNECTEIQFIDKHTAADLNLYPSLVEFVEMFDPENHVK